MRGVSPVKGQLLGFVPVCLQGELCSVLGVVVGIHGVAQEDVGDPVACLVGANNFRANVCLLWLVGLNVLNRRAVLIVDGENEASSLAGWSAVILRTVPRALHLLCYVMVGVEEGAGGRDYEGGLFRGIWPLIPRCALLCPQGGFH
jgi:hypothetical protein